MLVVHRGGRAGEVVDLVDLHVQRRGDVVAQHLEARVLPQVRDVRLAPGVVVVEAEHVVPGLEEPLAEVRPEEAGAAGDQDTLHGLFRELLVPDDDPVFFEVGDDALDRLLRSSARRSRAPAPPLAGSS